MKRRKKDGIGERIFWLLTERGEMRPVDIAKSLRVGRMCVYKGINRLMVAGKLERIGDVAWWRTYRIASGATPPDDGRGLSLGSRLALAKYRQAASDWWKECELARILTPPPTR